MRRTLRTGRPIGLPALPSQNQISEPRETAMLLELTWKVALLDAVIVADLVMFISLVAKELREVRASRVVDNVKRAGARQHLR
jgi:hypothetical protein